LVERWVDEKARTIENDCLSGDLDSQIDQIYKATQNTKRSVNFHSKFLLTSLSHTLAKNPEPAIADLHKYFDYNMRSKLTRQNADTGNTEFLGWIVKVH